MKALILKVSGLVSKAWPCVIGSEKRPREGTDEGILLVSVKTSIY